MHRECVHYRIRTHNEVVDRTGPSWGRTSPEFRASEFAPFHIFPMLSRHRRHQYSATSLRNQPAFFPRPLTGRTRSQHKVRGFSASQPTFEATVHCEAYPVIAACANRPDGPQIWRCMSASRASPVRRLGRMTRRLFRSAVQLCSPSGVPRIANRWDEGRGRADPRTVRAAPRGSPTSRPRPRSCLRRRWRR